MIVSSDDLFLDGLGKYVFDPARLDEAHAKCMRQFIEYLTNRDLPNSVVILRGISGCGKSSYARRIDSHRRLIVDNTNLRVVEIVPYWAVSRAYGLTPKIVEFPVTPEEVRNRNVHGVPDEDVRRQHRVMLSETLPSWMRPKDQA